MARYREIEEDVNNPTKETKVKHRDVGYNIHVHLAEEGCTRCPLDDGELYGIVGKFTSDATVGSGTINTVAAAICHPGGASPGMGGSARVHLKVV